MSAITQQLTIYEWLPAILGPGAQEVVELNEYDVEVNPQVANSVATAALRLHPMVIL